MTSLPATITAIEISEPGAPEVLRPASRPMPLPGMGEVLIEVKAAGVNRPDIQQRMGQYDPPPGASDIPGLEVGGTSGIGTTAIQLTRALGAHQIFATAGSIEKCRACEALGATRGIDYKIMDFVKVIREMTGGRGVDVILDMVGGDYLQKNLSALAMEGRLVHVAFLKGSKIEVNL